MPETLPHNPDDEPNGQELRQLAEQLHFRENQTMADLRAEIKTAPDYETAKELLIAYRGVAEQEADTLDDDQRSLALVGIPIGMAALYQENLRFEQLAEFLEDELEDAWNIANNLPVALLSDDILDRIGNL